MLSAVFLVNKDGVVLIEKQYRERIQRSELDLALTAIQDKTRVPPGIIPNGEYTLLLHLQDEIWLLGVCEGDEFALFAVSVLQYLGSLFATLLRDGATEISVKAEYPAVYQILDYAVDAGFPFLNENNTILTLLTGPQTDYAKGIRLQLDLQRPWRIVGAKHSPNQILVDVVETVDLIVRQDSRVEFCHIRGAVEVVSSLTDCPRCRLVLTPSSRWEDVTFHRSLEVDSPDVRVLPFYPADGRFTLLNYRITALQANLPLTIVPRFQWPRGGCHFEITMKPGANLVRALDQLVVRFELPGGVHQPVLTPSDGKAAFDLSANEVVWSLGTYSKTVAATLKGDASTESGFDLGGRFPIITAQFLTGGAAVSAFKVDTLDVETTAYKAFKGVKYVVKSGNYEFRTGLHFR
jgi:AP-3 complex subunit mu